MKHYFTPEILAPEQEPWGFRFVVVVPAVSRLMSDHAVEWLRVLTSILGLKPFGRQPGSGWRLGVELDSSALAVHLVWWRYLILWHATDD